MNAKRQAGQERRLQAAKKQYKKNRAGLREDRRMAKKEGRLAAALGKLGGRDAPQTAQDTIPYRQMHRDGICDVDGHYFTKQAEFLDINYQLAQNEDKNAIFENWCDFLNYFDSSIHFQLSFLNQKADMEQVRRSVDIPGQDDAFNGIRREYAGMLRSQLARGNNGLAKTKYVTFGVEADSLKAAKTRLERIEADVLANFKVLGVKARSMDGRERLSVLHRMMHPAGERKFVFSWDDIWKTGLSTKDYIAPDSFTFKVGQHFRVGQTYGAASFLQILAPELTDRMLADFLDLEGSLAMTLHIRSIDQGAAIRSIKRKLTDIDKMKIEEQVRPQGVGNSRNYGAAL